LYTVKVLIFASFEEDVRQRKIVTKDYLCQSLIVVTSTQHVNFSYSLHDQCGVFLSSVFCELFILYKTYTIYLIIGIFMCSHISYCTKAKCTFRSTSLLADDVLYWQDKIVLRITFVMWNLLTLFYLNGFIQRQARRQWY
jgi:hypothetical protein